LERSGRSAILDQINFVRQLATATFLEASMRNEWLGSLCVALCLLGSNAAYAGTKHIHNMDVKAQCIAKADAANLSGHERHAAIKQCRHEGSFFFPHA
jgi:hypothetical protein